jgi:hypothetical protein
MVRLTRKRMRGERELVGAKGKWGASSRTRAGTSAADEETPTSAGTPASRSDTPSAFCQLLEIAEANRLAPDDDMAVAEKVPAHVLPTMPSAPPSPALIPAPVAAPSNLRDGRGGCLESAYASEPQPTILAPEAPHPEEVPSPRYALAVAYRLNTHPSMAEMSAVASYLGLRTEVVAAWFDRRRHLEVWWQEIVEREQRAGRPPAP